MAAVPSSAADSDLGRGRIGWLEYLVVAGQLVLLLLLLRQYQVENTGFRVLAQVAFAGFLVHALLPLTWRLPFFALLSVAATGAVLGGENLAWMLAIGLVLIGLCHAPMSVSLRVAALLGVTVVLVLQRAGIMPAPWSEAIWPILGSMFMFRLILYFHDLRHGNAPASPARAVAYFFMIPNASFPLFPVVDHQAFRRNYFDDDAYRIYQMGIDWMVRGVLHLVLYRLVYYHLTLAPSEVTSPDLFFQYVVSNFLLYLKVSGLFHLVVGMLYLFGFRLPETHNRYFLASSFTDFWRRINIYWKDFMQKVFYYPAVFRLKRFGPNTAIIVATLWVFLMTWFLHAWQWFWIRGTALFVLQDILFWLILGVLVVVNSLIEMRRSRKRTLGKPAFSWGAILRITLKSYVTFWFICLLWSFWTSEHLADWLSLFRPLAGGYAASTLLWPLVTLAVIFLGHIPLTYFNEPKGQSIVSLGWVRARVPTFVIIATMGLISYEPVFSQFGPQVSTVVHSLRHVGLSRLDAAKLERGYYEGLTDVNRFNSQLWETYAKRPRDWLDNQGGGLKRYVDGFEQTEMIPSFVFETGYGTITTNSHGMRDREYPPVPAPGTFRAAMLGASTVMGWGVPDGATFEALLERRLNEERPGQPFERYEILNFGVQGYQPPQQLVGFERALVHEPNAVIYIATGREITRSVNYLAEVVLKGIEIPYPSLRAIVREAAVGADMAEAEVRRRLAPHGPAILEYVYRRIADGSRARDMHPIWVFLPQVRPGTWQDETESFVAMAEEAGFAILRLDDVFSDHPLERIRLAEWDEHPTAFGHELIADALFEQFAKFPDRFLAPVQVPR